MESNHADLVLNEKVQIYAKYKAQCLRESLRLPNDVQEDILQELQIELCRKVVDWDPVLGAGWRTFAHMVIDKKIANLAKELTAKKRDHRKTCSLDGMNEASEIDFGVPDQLAGPDSPLTVENEDRTAECRVDLQRVLQQLPEKVAAVAKNMPHFTGRELAGLLGISSTTLTRYKSMIRAALAKAGLQHYFDLSRALPSEGVAPVLKVVSTTTHTEAATHLAEAAVADNVTSISAPAAQLQSTGDVKEPAAALAPVPATAETINNDAISKTTHRRKKTPLTVGSLAPLFGISFSAENRTGMVDRRLFEIPLSGYKARSLALRIDGAEVFRFATNLVQRCSRRLPVACRSGGSEVGSQRPGSLPFGTRASRALRVSNDLGPPAFGRAGPHGCLPMPKARDGPGDPQAQIPIKGETFERIHLPLPVHRRYANHNDSTLFQTGPDCRRIPLQPRSVVC